MAADWLVRCACISTEDWRVSSRLTTKVGADGHDQKRIAVEPGISPKTVATHIQNLLGKFGAHSRAQLVALASKSGVFGIR